MVKIHPRIPVLISAALLAVAVQLLVVVACGPDFQPDVFTPSDHPEDLKTYAAGKLGILQPGFWEADKIVAYRYLTGGHLSPAEQAVYNPFPSPSSNLDWQAQERAREEQMPANRWVAARAEFSSQALAIKPSAYRTVEIKRQNYVERDEQLNCTDNAFNTAIATLYARAATWGSGSGDLTDWIAGQDAVFSNCTQPGSQPKPAPAGASLLLRQDRAYQLAAAYFYAGQYDQAIAAFESVAHDKLSPWAKWGEYLAARAEIRKAASIAPDADWAQQAKFDPALMQSAEARLQRVAQTSDLQIRHAALDELSFVNVRLEPRKHLNEVATALAGPSPDPNFSRDLDDLQFLSDHNVSGDTDLLRWMGLVKGGITKVNAFGQWSSTHSDAWLISALAAAKPNSSEASVLISATAKLRADSPAYATANYYSIDLLLRSGQREQARQLATTLLNTLSGDGMTGSRNAVLGLRMLTAPTFTAFLGDAPRTRIDSGSLSEAAANLLCTAGSRTSGCVDQIPTAQFDEDVVKIFNGQLPLTLWIEAASPHSPLPKNLRQAVAWAGWVRAVGLNDKAAVKQLAPMLPPSVRATVSNSTGFPATLAMLRSPGLRPYLNQGVQRSASYGEREIFRDNWWCGRWSDGSSLTAHSPAAFSSPEVLPGFLTPAQQDAAKTEAAALDQLPGGVIWLGRRAIDYIKAHPEDPNAAEALALTVRATRYGCYLPPDKEASDKDISKEAFQLLHKHYSASGWTAKTPYYY
jgi:tetratricopeptide (TPR) repeat protein